MPREQTPRGINHWHKALLKTLHSVLNDGPDWAAGDSSSDVTPNAELIGEIMHGRSRDDIPLLEIVEVVLTPLLTIFLIKLSL